MFVLWEQIFFCLLFFCLLFVILSCLVVNTRHKRLFTKASGIDGWSELSINDNDCVWIMCCVLLAKDDDFTECFVFVCFFVGDDDAGSVKLRSDAVRHFVIRRDIGTTVPCFSLCVTQWHKKNKVICPC